METIVQRIEKLWQQIRHYADTRVSIIKLKSADKVAGVLSKMMVMVLLTVSMVLCVLIGSIGIAAWINTRMESSYAGLLIVSAFYALVCVLLFALRKRLFRLVLTKYMLRKVMKLHVD